MRDDHEKLYMPMRYDPALVEAPELIYALGTYPAEAWARAEELGFSAKQKRKEGWRAVRVRIEPYVDRA